MSSVSRSNNWFCLCPSLVFISDAAKGTGPVFLPLRRNIQWCWVSPQQKPVPKGAAHDPLTRSSFLPLQPSPNGQLSTPLPIHHSWLSGHCQKPPAKRQWQPRVPIHPERKGPVRAE